MRSNKVRPKMDVKEFYADSFREFADGLNIKLFGDGVRYKIKKKKVKKVKSALAVKASNIYIVGDNPRVRTLEKHRFHVNQHARAYDAGFDPLTRKDIRDIESFEYFDEIDGELVERATPKAINEYEVSQAKKDFTPPAYSPNRHPRKEETKGMALLTTLMYKNNQGYELPDDD